MPVKPIPEGYHTVTPYLTVRGVAKLMDFLKRSFGAVEKERMTQPDGRIMHAEVRIGDSVVMMGEPADESSLMPGAIHVYVEDVDTIYRRALQAGATSLRAPEDQFYGDRSAGVRDPSGNVWWIATHKEDVSPEEMKRRAEAFMRQHIG
jgi:PhnB protein